METFEENCNELERVLSGVEDHCQAILTDLNEFEEYAASYTIRRLVRKLTILAFWVIATTEQLYKEHSFQGYVCVFLSERNGLAAHWVETEEIVANKAFFEAGGSKVFSLEEANNIIAEMIKELGAGNWVKVVDWMNRYGKSPGLDFNKFL